MSDVFRLFWLNYIHANYVHLVDSNIVRFFTRHIKNDKCEHGPIIIMLHSKSCSAGQEEGPGPRCSSTTPRTKTSGASVWAWCTERFTRRARRAANCRRTTRDRPMSTTNPGSGKRITSPKLSQVTGNGFHRSVVNSLLKGDL